MLNVIYIFIIIVNNGDFIVRYIFKQKPGHVCFAFQILHSITNMCVKLAYYVNFWIFE